MTGRVVLITGASKGVGRATAARFANAGARVAMLARGAEQLETEAAALGEAAFPIVCDVSDPDDVRAAFARVEGELGRLDVLVNNVGIGGPGLIDELTDEAIQQIIGTSFLGVVFCTRQAIPLLRAAGGGDIVNVGSEVIDKHPPLFSMYVAAKSAVAAFSKFANSELRPDGIRVAHCVLGRVATEFSSSAAEVSSVSNSTRYQRDLAEVGSFIEKQVGMTELDPSEVADAIFFAATRPRSQMIDEIRIRGRI